MKIQCNVCEAAEATVLCCSDEAALCWPCDHNVHSANKLAGKHHRVPISSSTSQLPKCDICQEASGFFFCLQDRALLCRKCDVSVHSANAYVSAHQRFLLTGVKVGGAEEEPTNPPPASSFSPNLPHPTENTSEAKFNSTLQRRDTSKPLTVDYNDDRVANTSTERGLSSIGGTGNFSSWQIDDFFGFTDFSHNLGCTDHNGSSKADSSKRGSSDSSSFMRTAEVGMDDDECLGEVPTSWSVPEISSPPTASGMHWPKDPWTRSDCVASVPDLCCPPQYPSYCEHRRTQTKRRRQF